MDEKDAAFGPLNKALDAVAKIALEINASVHTREAQLRVLDIQNHLTGDKVFELVTPTRYYVCVAATTPICDAYDACDAMGMGMGNGMWDGGTDRVI